VSPSDEKRFEVLRRVLLDQQADLARLRASVRVLRACVASLLEPDSPERAEEQFEILERQFLDADPIEKGRRENAEILEALKLLRKRGARGEDS